MTFVQVHNLCFFLFSRLDCKQGTSPLFCQELDISRGAPYPAIAFLSVFLKIKMIRGQNPVFQPAIYRTQADDGGVAQTCLHTLTRFRAVACMFVLCTWSETTVHGSVLCPSLPVFAPCCRLVRSSHPPLTAVTHSPWGGGGGRGAPGPRPPRL